MKYKRFDSETFSQMKSSGLTNSNNNLYIEYPENEHYKLFKQLVHENNIFETNEDEVCSFVDGKIPYISNALTIQTKFGSYIRVKSKGNNIDISSIQSFKKGDGTMLMNYILGLLTRVMDELGYTDIVLTCTGAVGVGSNIVKSDISDQMKFFRKFGFRLDGKFSRNIVNMIFHKDKYTPIMNDFKKIENYI